MTTKIEWTDETWNPVTGCTPISPGCANCYAKRMARRLAGRCGYPEAPHHFDVTLQGDRYIESKGCTVLELPLKWRKPRHIFVCSMSDLFHEDVPFSFIAKIYNDVFWPLRGIHTFQILTKRADRMLEFYRWFGSIGADIIWHFPHVWLGVTAENQDQADKRIPILLQIPAAVRFVSVEPMLGEIKLFLKLIPIRRMYGPDCVHLDWVICGAETGPGARPMHPDWARSLRDQCQAAGVPFFFKSWGEWQLDKPFPACAYWDDKDGVRWWRTGKKHTGRTLDGRLWEEMPR